MFKIIPILCLFQKGKKDCYDHKPKSCVNGFNINLRKDYSVEQCKGWCDSVPECVAFEYGVAYGGAGGYKPRDCQLQSSQDNRGCDAAYHNLDLYVNICRGLGI